jgi:hypothetical protein
MTSRIRLIGLVGAGAITSAAFCSLYLVYTVERSKFVLSASGDAALEQTLAQEEAGSVEVEEAVVPPPVAADKPKAEQAFLVAFLADANPQVRTLAAWGLMSSDEAEESQRELLEFVRQERNPEVRIALYRFMQGQRSIPCRTLVELVQQEEETNQTWLASCDLLAGVVQNGSSKETKEFFNHTIVPKLERLALGAEDLHSRIAAIITLRRAGTHDALEALRQITRLSTDPQVVRAASSAVGFVALE